MADEMKYVDMFGREIKVGDYIVYAALADRSGVLRAGQVVALTTGKESYRMGANLKVRVKSWNNFRAQGYSWEDESVERSGRQKDVTLSFLDRLIVVDPDTVSEKVKKDLAGPPTGWNGQPIA